MIKNTRFTIQGEMPTLNEEIDGAKKHWSNYSSVKRQWTNLVAMAAREAKLTPIDKDSLPVSLHFIWYMPNKRKDPDNIAFAKKYILDGLVLEGILPNDGWKMVNGFVDSFFLDKENPRVVVDLLFIGADNHFVETVSYDEGSGVYQMISPSTTSIIREHILND